jgi:hypothetical protein
VISTIEDGAVVGYWLLSGSTSNWTQTIKETEHLWATRDTARLRSSVQRIARGDTLVFYVTRPIAGVIGFGVAESERFTGTMPYWPDEKKARKVLYPHRFKISFVRLLPKDQWRNKTLRPDKIGLRLSIFRSLNTVTEEQVTLMEEECLKTWADVPLIEEKRKEKEEGVQPPPPPPNGPDHDQIMVMIGEIGRLKGLVVEKEYPINNMRLDVAWKKVAMGNPHAAFEVQIGGNFFEALTKLKHAWDMWRSVPILITTDEYADKARQLIEGSFHEIRRHLRIIDFKEIEELYNA